QAEVIIEPGSEIAIGRVTLIAESMRSIVLRTFLSRVIGWTDDRLHDIDFALRSIRITSARRAPLALYGNDDLVSIAYDIHRLAFGELKPFVLCDPERTTKDRIRRGVSVLKAAAEAIDAAAGGSICVWATRRPSEFPDLARRLALPSTVAQLVIVGRDAGSVESYGAKPIEIPLLHHRNAEIEQIVRGYGDDARERLVTSLRLHSKGREWVRKHCATALGEIQKGTERVLALKHFGNFAKAANWLGISPQGLTHWMESRDITSMDGLDAY
ncbi:MAG TPA: hypothetical protein VHZ95_15180, partial [Polyangiales bacterium]|nr:hypothetical protein [Polyangiales bacterium]